MDPAATQRREGPGAPPTPGAGEPALDERLSHAWRHGGARRGSPAFIAVLYVAIGLAWVAFSDRALEVFVDDPAVRMQLGTLKGLLYVTVTGAALFLLIWRSEERLRRFGEELRATLDSLGDGVLVISAGGRVVEINRSVMDLTGILRKEEHFVSLTDWALLVNLRHPDGRPVTSDQFASLRVLRGERAGSYDAVIRRTDGTDLPITVTASPVFDRAGRPRLAVAVLRDTSEAHRLSQTREELLATAAHELKTPLSVIKAHAQLLLRRTDPEPGLQVIVRQVDRLTRLVQQILDSSRLRMDNIELRWERLDLAEVGAVVVSDMGPRPGGHSVAFEGRGGAWVRADRDRLTRVITALVDNALRFSPAETPVEVRVGVRGGEAIFSVLDHGVGIPPERQDRVFERYYRAHAGTPEDRGGLGVGLDTCREIIARHGGRMWFESEPGTGSTFLFALPSAGDEAEA